MSDNIGGAGALLFIFAPPVLGGAAGALLAPKHRLMGALAGAGVGFVSMILLSRAISASETIAPDQLPPPTPITDLAAWQKTPFGSEMDPNSPAFACRQATRERNAGVVGGPWATKCNAWRNQ